MKARTLTFCIALTVLAQTGIHAQKVQEASLYVETEVPKTEVYLNGIFQGLTPLTIKPIKPGIMELTLKKSGYYSVSYRIQIQEGEQKIISVALDRITGILRVENAPPGAKIIIDGTEYTSSRIILPEGFSTVVIKAFGYTEISRNISIAPRSELKIDGTLEKAAFAIENLHARKKAFNPENPAGLGLLEISFRVTAPGTGTLLLLGSDAISVREIPVGPFKTWDQTVRWDGKNQNGSTVPDGTYTIVLAPTPQEPIPQEPSLQESSLSETLIAEHPITEQTLSAQVLTDAVQVDRTIIYPNTDGFKGIGAVGPVISGALMPKGGTLLHFDVMYFPGVIAPGFSGLFGFSHGIEAGLQAAMLIDENSEGAMEFSGGLKLGTQWGRAYPALVLRYSANTLIDSQNASPYQKGLSFGSTIEWRLHNFSFDANANILWGDGNGFFNKPYLTSSFGTSVRYSSGIFTGVIWGYAETARFADVGIGAQCLIPSTNLLFSVQTGYQFGFAEKNSFFARGGFGILL